MHDRLTCGLIGGWSYMQHNSREDGMKNSYNFAAISLIHRC